MTTLHSYNSSCQRKGIQIELLTRSWWVYLFVGLTLLGFFVASGQAEKQTKKLKASYQSLEKSRDQLRNKNEKLIFQIKSLEDQKTVEMIIKKELGMISEGQTKVYFVAPH